MTSAPLRDLSVPRALDEPTPVPLEPDADLSGLDEAKILSAPAARGERARWRTVLAAWREQARGRIHYDDALYAAGPSWPADCAAVFLVWLWDQRLYDGQEFTVESYHRDMLRQFGAVDAVVLWHAYPVIGLDERNQWDYYRDVPDLDDVVHRFHTLGVRVFCDYNPWDVGTRRAPGTDADELADVVRAYGFDGVFLDTLKSGAPEIRDALGPDVALEGESRVPLDGIATHTSSWAQWFADTAAPGVLRAHWFERRHMMHHVRRWNRDHSAELQSAFVNGVGVLVWDDVFGVWVGWNARDRSTLRAIARVRAELRDLFTNGVWTPLADLDPQAESAGVFAHRYDHDGLTLWTVVNRAATDYRGPVRTVPDDLEWLDVTWGHAVAPGELVVPARSIAGAVQLPRRHPRYATLRALADHGRGNGESDATFPTRTVTIIHATAAPVAAAPGGTVTVGGHHMLPVRYRRRETAEGDETPWIDAWKPLPPELHAVVTENRAVDVPSAAVDRLEVSNAQFHAFLAETGYRPTVSHRFLAHWADGAPRPGTEDEPVVFIDLDDARAYAAFTGRRLPTTAGWQVAMVNGAQRRQPAVWNWTDPEHRDGATRWVHLKGGSDYAAAGSDWYVDGGVQAPDWELKLVLPGGGLDRSSRVGFRTAVDVSTYGDES